MSSHKASSRKVSRDTTESPEKLEMSTLHACAERLGFVGWWGVEGGGLGMGRRLKCLECQNAFDVCRKSLKDKYNKRL